MIKVILHRSQINPTKPTDTSICRQWGFILLILGIPFYLFIKRKEGL